MRLRLGMLASHGGTNVQSVVQASREGRLPAEPALIISNNRDSAVLDLGRSRGLPSVWIGGAAYEAEALRDKAICAQLSSHGVDVVLLLGYMRKLGPATLGCSTATIQQRFKLDGDPGLPDGLRAAVVSDIILSGKLVCFLTTRSSRRAKKSRSCPSRIGGSAPQVESPPFPLRPLAR